MEVQDQDRDVTRKKVLPDLWMSGSRMRCWAPCSQTLPISLRSKPAALWSTASLSPRKALLSVSFSPSLAPSLPSNLPSVLCICSGAVWSLTLCYFLRRRK